MPDGDILYSHGFVELLHRGFISCVAHDVVSRNVGMARIDASSHRNVFPQGLDKLRYLLEASAQRELGSGGVFDEYRKLRRFEVESITGFAQGFGSTLQTIFA